MPSSRIEPVTCALRAVVQAQDRHAGHGLARAGLAHDAEGLAASTVKLSPSTALTRPSAVGKWTLRSVDGQQRLSKSSAVLLLSRLGRAGR